MSIKADCHLHSSFSGDSQAPMPEMIDKGLALGLETMCFTEHNDFDYPRTEEGPGTIFLLNTDSYLYDVLRCRAKYEGKMRILFGVELGLQPHLADRNEDFISAYDFDFVIGSTHLCKGSAAGKRSGTEHRKLPLRSQTASSLYRCSAPLS